MYKNMKHGITFQGQTAIFKFRFAEERPNFIREISRYTYWIDNWKTEYKGKTYYYIAGSFHHSQMPKFYKSHLMASTLRDIEKSLQTLAKLEQDQM